MIAHGFDDYTVMSMSGHSSTRMLERYTHPDNQARARGARDFWDRGPNRPQKAKAGAPDDAPASDLQKFFENVGGRQEARTPDLRVANAALSQLS